MCVPQDCQRKRGILFVVSGPSGVGKDTVLERAFQRLSGIVRSVSATTRPPRNGEVEGIDYYFYSQDRFLAEIEQNAFLEYAQYGKNYYGTPSAPVEANLEAGNDVILKIEVQGALKIKHLRPDARLIFIQPPHFDILEARLKHRSTDSPEKIAERLEIAKQELAQRHEYHHLMTNDGLEEAVDALCAIITAERSRVQNESAPEI